MEVLDVVIVGAGWHGLVMAKTYLEVNPSVKVAVLEAASTIGGVWAKHRLYTACQTNNLAGTYEYSDFPMDEATFGVKTGHHIPGQTVHAYLNAYAEEFNLMGKIWLNSKVESAEYSSNHSWRLSVVRQNEVSPAKTSIRTSKLIMATGMTSQPFLPSFEGQDVFGAPRFHFRDLAANEESVRMQGGRVTVLGGTKSAWDAVYACVSSGIPVDWVIRESGHGPVWMAPPYVTPLKRSLEKFPVTRLLTLFSPCIWGDTDGFSKARKFLHGTWFGRKIVNAFWAALEMDVNHTNKYDQHPEIKKLKPWVSTFWVGTSFSILNYPTDFFQYIKDGKIKIHISDIDHLSTNTVHLTDGEQLTSNALICCTGWRSTPEIKFLPEGIDQDLGLPWGKDIIAKDTIDVANNEILHRFPRLKDQPTLNTRFKPIADDAESSVPHPFRLARFMVPPMMREDRSIVFLGTVMTFNTALIAQTQALWAAAYLENKLSVLPADHLHLSSFHSARAKVAPKLEDNILLETALHTEFGRLRYPGGFGKRNPDFAFDALPYLDLLLKDLGLPPRRKQTFLAHLFEPHGVEDYRGLIKEWKALHQTKAVATKGAVVEEQYACDSSKLAQPF